jgi:hypothetical protein
MTRNRTPVFGAAHRGETVQRLPSSLAPRGIGKAVAQLASDGYAAIIADLRSDAAGETARQMPVEPPRRSTAT